MELSSGAHSNFVSSGHACARLCNAAWECPPSWERATDAREKKSSLAILRPEGRGSSRFKPKIGRSDRLEAVCTVQIGWTGAVPASWARRERTGLNARELGRGRERGRAGARTRKAVAGPNLRANWVARSGPNPRRGRTGRAFGLGRVVSAGLGRTGWADSIGLDLHKLKRWVEPVRGRTREKMKLGRGEESGGRGQRLPPLGAVATAQETETSTAWTTPCSGWAS
ncbi:hypothetical protein CRG98_002946 [Punica granatum]|uniref:Uncharacterized protein n=1 Tax=Punica granatum TaxID=22663 RepID=A0A2I0L7G5_PUNGR|nr:hypothetical protein CRG98_002946 [Punica granatum]